ncbi:Uncharacterised protein [Escherichia coli]|nr:Uncharacterised protein [Escherichia coli]
MSVMRVPTASAQRMKLLADGVTTNYSLRPPSLMVNDSQRAACMSLMAIFCVGSIISTRCTPCTCSAAAMADNATS